MGSHEREGRSLSQASQELEARLTPANPSYVGCDHGFVDLRWAFAIVIAHHCERRSRRCEIGGVPGAERIMKGA